MSRPCPSLRKPRLALVLWNGDLGGAEILNARLAEHMLQRGAKVTIVFVSTPQPLAEHLARAGVPYRSLSLGRGRNVLRHPRRFAAEIAHTGPDGALLVECGFIGAALRVGGYRGPVVAVAHGTLLDRRGLSRLRRLFMRIARASGAWADDAEIAVSDFMLKWMHGYPHARRIRRIYNGIDPAPYVSASRLDPRPEPEERALVAAFAGRLIREKGANRLIEAVAKLRLTQPIRLRIAGDGPDRDRLESLVYSLGIEGTVEFVGLTHDMPAFWQMSDIAVVPSEITESFSMTTLEAMASGKPVIATRNGGIPELVVDEETGMLVPPGDVDALVKALCFYADKELRASHGAAGQARVMECFHIDGCAQAYLDLFAELATKRSARALWLGG